MMPDLGKYAQAVLSSYAVSIALLVVLVARLKIEAESTNNKQSRIGRSFVRSLVRGALGLEHNIVVVFPWAALPLLHHLPH